MLLDYNKKELEELGRLYGLKGAYKLKKAELIEALIKWMPTNIVRVLVMLSIEELEIFEKLMAKDKRVDDPQEILDYYTLLDLALVELIETRDSARLTINSNIKKEYKKIEQTLLRDQIRANSKIRTHIMGLLNLYGAVQINWVVELYNRYHTGILDERQLIDFARRDRVISSRSLVIDNYIVEETIYSIDDQNFYEFLELTKDKQYYIPTKAYIEQMSDELYYDNTLQVQKLKSYIRKNFTQDAEIIEEAILTVVMIARVDCDKTGNAIKLMLEDWEDIGIGIKDLKQANEVLEHIVSVVNTTRKWINKGHTPDELRSYLVSNERGTRGRTKVRTLDVGRNALCPCGSGKKYKVCCGKPH